MKLVRWTRFTWDLTKLPEVQMEPAPPYRIRSAVKGEKGAVRDVLTGAFSLDMDWNDMMASLRERFDDAVDEAFHGRDIRCLVLTNGSRLIGASALDTGVGVENHLLSGPCVLNEYRNRGFGSVLLYHSLLRLRDAGLSQAHGITRQNVPAAKFLYTKFNSVGGPCTSEPQLVGS